MGVKNFKMKRFTSIFGIQKVANLWGSLLVLATASKPRSSLQFLNHSNKCIAYPWNYICNLEDESRTYEKVYLQQIIHNYVILYDMSKFLKKKNEEERRHLLFNQSYYYIASLFDQIQYIISWAFRAPDEFRNPSWS